MFPSLMIISFWKLRKIDKAQQPARPLSMMMKQVGTGGRLLTGQRPCVSCQCPDVHIRRRC